MAECQLTQEYVRSLFDYDPDTGILTWKWRDDASASTKSALASINARFAGKQAGAPHKGYIRMYVAGEQYYAHRLIWLLVHGEWPDCIDHIIKDRSDNRLINLRSVSQAENMRNSGMSSKNTSGVTGVSWSNTNKGWCAYITNNRKRIYLGTFPDFGDAIAARKAAEIRFGFHPNHGK